MSTSRSRCAPWCASAVVAATAFASPATASAGTTVGAGESWILYQDCSGQRCVVTLVRPDGTGMHQLASELSSSDQSNPDWSPDGNQIVFIAVDRNGTEDLWTINADGTDATKLIDCEAPCVWLDDPDWGPDGTSIAYSRVAERDGTGVGTLEIYHLDTGETEVVLPEHTSDFYAGQRYSPDGKSIVLEVVHKDNDSLEFEVTDVTLSVVDLTASPLPTITAISDPGVWPELADWSPDGDLIVYAQLAAPDTEGHDLFTVRPDGSARTQLTTFAAEGGFASHAGWSPDGSAIICVAQPDGDSETGLTLVDAGGAHPRPAVGETYVPGDHPRLRPTP